MNIREYIEGDESRLTGRKEENKVIYMDMANDEVVNVKDQPANLVHVEGYKSKSRFHRYCKSCESHVRIDGWRERNESEINYKRFRALECLSCSGGEALEVVPPVPPVEFKPSPSINLNSALSKAQAEARSRVGNALSLDDESRDEKIRLHEERMKADKARILEEYNRAERAKDEAEREIEDKRARAEAEIEARRARADKEDKIREQRRRVSEDVAGVTSGFVNRLKLEGLPDDIEITMQDEPYNPDSGIQPRLGDAWEDSDTGALTVITGFDYDGAPVATFYGVQYGGRDLVENIDLEDEELYEEVYETRKVYKAASGSDALFVIMGIPVLFTLIPALINYMYMTMPESTGEALIREHTGLSASLTTGLCYGIVLVVMEIERTNSTTINKVIPLLSMMVLCVVSLLLQS